MELKENIGNVLHPKTARNIGYVIPGPMIAGSAQNMREGFWDFGDFVLLTASYEDLKINSSSILVKLESTKKEEFYLVKLTNLAFTNSHKNVIKVGILQQEIDNLTLLQFMGGKEYNKLKDKNK